MATKKPKSERIEIKLKQEFLSFHEPVQHVIEGVTVSRDDWFELTGEITSQPVRLLRLPDDIRKDYADAMKIGRAIRALQSLSRQYGSNIHITLDGDDIDVSNGNGEMIAFAKEHDFEFDEDALMFEHIAEMATKAFKS